jgi:hypothetical protein
MHPYLASTAVAILLGLSTGPGPEFGHITAVIANPPTAAPGQKVTIIVAGTGTCHRIALNLGRRDVILEHVALPYKVMLAYPIPGTYTIRASGMPPKVQCTGGGSATLTVQ